MRTIDQKYHRTSFKRDIDKYTISNFKYLLKDNAWANVLINENASESYGSILCKFTDLYNITFPKKEVKIKRKNFISP